MKTSNKLILLLFALLFVSIIGSSFSLKSKFDKIDMNDPYLGYSRDTLPPFRYVKLTGNAFGTVQLQPGKIFEMRMIDIRNYNDHPKVSHFISGDTLILSFTRDGPRGTLWDGTFKINPSVYISAPEIAGLTSNLVPCIVKGWQSSDFNIQQSGQGVLLSNNQFENLNITGQNGAYININKGNKFGSTLLTLKDSSTFVSKKDVFKSFSLQSDDAAQVDIPVGLMKKTTQK